MPRPKLTNDERRTQLLSEFADELRLTFGPGSVRMRKLLRLLPSSEVTTVLEFVFMIAPKREEELGVKKPLKAKKQDEFVRFANSLMGSNELGK